MSLLGRCLPRRASVYLFLLVLLLLHVIVLVTYFNNRYRSEISSKPMLYTKDFEVRLGEREMSMLMTTLDMFVTTLNNASIPFFMYGGTLVGSWRHHGQIPWDDDIDFALPHTLKQNISDILGRLKPDFILNEEQGVRWKLFSANAMKIRSVSWKFPFLDISFYVENETHVWDEDVKNFKSFIFPRDMVFPLRPRPFEGRQLPAPKNSKGMLDHNYDLDLCMTGRYNHRRETGGESVHKVKCQELRTLFPFVQRVALGQRGCNETLVYQGHVLSWKAFLTSPC